MYFGVSERTSLKKLPPPGCSLFADYDFFHMGGNTDKNCSICNLKETPQSDFR